MLEHWRTAMARDWAEALAPEADTFERLGAFLSAAPTAVLPAPHRILRAFELPMDQVRVLIVGQDPYPTPGDAVGLSFAVAPERALPPSLRNIARELRDDTGEELGSGDLAPWAAQGVLLLNRVLTVSPGAAGSHRRQGWEQITQRAIEALASRGGPLVAVLWGNDAQALAPALAHVARIESAHPSPLSARRGFFGSRPFSRVNSALEAQGAAPITWSIPPEQPVLL